MLVHCLTVSQLISLYCLHTTQGLIKYSDVIAMEI